MKIATITLFFIFAISNSFSQKYVSITIDDVPNTRLYKQSHNTSKLMRALDSLKIPIAIFINEKNISKTGSEASNKALLKSWIMKSYITPGNHSYSHWRYSETDLMPFIKF